jgi:Cu-Zn family superoxide dismutase
MADEATVRVNKISANGIGVAIGTITIKDTGHGVTISPNLKSVPPGKHGFHIHQKPNCGPGKKGGKSIAGLQAGGHYDPTGAGAKRGQGKPHGDLPELIAGADGRAVKPVMSSKLTVAKLRGRSIMVHRYGENEPGKPKGGGPRFACGVIPN